MLLYNQRKEFIGIDADDLNSLGFANLNELLSESNDFADLFVKKPGYIHNFKNFSWIDFILHSETGESKAIIHVLGKNYSCTLHVAPFHFTSDESGFGIVIKSLQLLRGQEDAIATKSIQDSGGIQATPVSAPIKAPKASPNIAPEPLAPSFNAPEDNTSLDINLDDMLLDEPVDNILDDEPSLPSFDDDLELSEPDLLDIPLSQEIDLGLSSAAEESFELPQENEFGAPLDLDAPLDIEEDLSLETPEPEMGLEDFDLPDDDFNLPEEETSVIEEAPMLGDYVSAPTQSEHLSDLITSGTYKYNPQVAADELGLPVDLIEEFIGDFIDQAHEFHDDLFASVKSEDFDNVQILSHKLKGVAANLRVEDAFDTLSVVNVSKDIDEVLPNLEQFYKIIAKLEGKEVIEPETAPVAPVSVPEVTEPEILEEEFVEPEPEPELSIGLKQPDDAPMLIDEDVTEMNDDDLYADLLGTPEVSEAPEPEEETSFEQESDDDLYGDLLGTPEPIEEAPLVQETATTEDEDDLYDDLLATPESTEEPELQEQEEELTQEATEVQETQVPQINFDSQRAANELGIPLDIVNEFVQDFKEQVDSHMGDFDSAILAEDTQGVKKTATLLKGMSDNLRLNEISEVLKELQHSADTSDAQDKLLTLKAYANQL